VELLKRVVAVRAGIFGAVLFVEAAVFTRAGVGVLTGLLGTIATCVAAAVLLTLGYALLVGTTGWALLTGFVVNADGALTFGGGDLRHLAILLGLSAATSVLAEHHRSGSSV